MPTYSYSRVKTWRRCHKAHDYKYNQRLTKKRKNVRLFRGEILHEMLNARALNLLHPKAGKSTPEQILSKYAKKYRVLLKQEKEMYGDLIEDIRRIFDNYQRFYTEDEYEVLASEEPVLTTIRDDIKFVGYTDKRVKDAEGRMWIKDHKTVKNLPDDDSRFSDYQLILYPWAWNRENGGKEVSGIIWDYIRTKPPTIPEQLKDGSLSQRANIDTDYFTYLAEINRLELNPKGYKEILKSLKEKRNTFFRRIVLPTPSKKTTEIVVNDFRASVSEIESLSKTSAGQIRSMSYDCKTCEFYQLCQAEIRDLDSDFIRKVDYVEKEPEETVDAEESE